MNRLDYLPVNHSIEAFVDFSFDISDRLVEIMQRKGINQKQMADLLGKSESEINKWLSGVHNFTIKTVKHIEVVLNSPIIEIAKEDSTPVDYEVKSSEYHDPVDCQECISSIDSPFLPKIEAKDKILVPYGY